MAYILMIFCFLLTCLFQFSQQTSSHPLIYSLSNSTWRVRNEKGDINIAASVPGGIYTDLRHARILKGNLFYSDNDIKFRWVSKEDWFYSATFNVTSELLNKQHVFLTFHGLDTVCKIYLNDVFIAATDNMFVRYRFDIKEHVKVGSNSLQVHFFSPVTTAFNKSYNYHQMYKYDVPPACTVPVQHGECHVNFLRKMQASFSWDWGPAFPSVGIWKAVEIEAFNSVIVRSVSIGTVNKNANFWEISGVIYLDTAPFKKVTASLKMNVQMKGTSTPIIQEPIVFSNLTTVADENGEASFNFRNIHVHEDLVKLWWPNGYGKQHLYDFKISLVSNLDSGHEETSHSTTFGFRTVKLIQQPVDPAAHSKGLTFYFEVNKVKIFAKGSNYIPSHILPELNDNQRTLAYLIDSAKYANMNMLRVWGGGVYESDLFYELCDKHGIMIWQDMMFACAMYPSSEEFLNSVSKEVVQNVRRLQSHPSIVIWAGNNENEAALRGNWYGTHERFDLYKSDYIKLYVVAVRRLVLDNDDTREYVVSSPSNGIESEWEGYIASDPYSPLYGDVHVYQYFTDNWDPYNILPARFSSEYGIQSLPSYSTLSSVCKPEDLKVNSTFLQLRQHHGSGYSEMVFEIDMNIPNFNKSDLHQFIYFSQVNQAMSMKTMTEKYRSLRDVLNRNGEGLTMGALYWQLNDVWQAPSWSSIEFGGKWKMLHYFAKKFFSPVLLFPSVYINDMTVKIIVDRLEELPIDDNITVSVNASVFRWDSFNNIKNFSVCTTIKQFSTMTILEGSYTDLIGTETECGFTSNQISHNCFMTFKVNSEKSFISDNFLFFERLTAVKLKQADISVNIKELPIRKCNSFVSNPVQIFQLKITTTEIALFVWLDIGKLSGYFTDNGFHMTTPEVDVDLCLSKYTTMRELQSVLNVMSVNGKYIGVS